VFYRLGRFSASHARAVLAISAVLLIAFAVLGVGAFGSLKGNGFDDPKSGSTQAKNLIEQHFVGDPDFVLLVSARHGTVNDPAVAAAGAALTKRARADHRLIVITSYWASKSPGLRSRDSSDALILTRVRGTQDQAGDLSSGLIHDYSHLSTAAAVVKVGGSEGTDVGGQVGHDIGVAESIAVPITLILLIIVFGSLVAASLPLAVGVFAIFGAFAELSVLTHFVDVSVFAINLVTALGLGLGIDYALLMVSRLREELANGYDVAEAVARTTATAGRTIAFSALTVMVALSAMLVFPVYFLKSFAYGGIGVTIFGALGALVVLPALLGVLGHRVNAGKVPGIRADRGAEAPFWGHLAGAVMRRPIVAAVPVLAVLLILAAPFLHVSFGTPDARVLPTSNQAHQVSDILNRDFVTQPATVDVIVRPAVASGELRDYARRLSALPGVQRDDSSAGSFAAGQPARPSVDPAELTAGDAQRLTVTTGLNPASNAAVRLVRQVRSMSVPPGATAVVGGQTAELIDAKHAIASRLLLAGLIIAVTSFVLLFLFTGSILQPVRALLGNLLTLCATFGVMVWIFQDGHLSSILGFTPSPTNTDMPVLLFCVAFGLSMDYEVFVISRIKEAHDRGATNEVAVTGGLAHTGRIVSTAAALLAVSFFAFGTSHVSFIQFFGLGTGLAILIDATLVRGVLVPAFMRAFGENSWYAPAPLRKLHDRLGLSEATEPSPREHTSNVALPLNS
jgi:putative drug exporter of the RND superfamily